MARIPDSELERLKAEVSIERLAEARGLKLTRKGRDLYAQCPFHEGDREASLVISPATNLWHCLGACNAGGSVIDWVMRAEGVSFRHAVEFLRADLPPSAAAGPLPVVQRSTVRKLPRVLPADAEDQVLLRQVVDFYHETLKQSPEALAYLQGRGLTDSGMVDQFKLGFANRTLGYRLPAKNRKEGASVRGRLETLGIYRESGHEHLAGSLVIPIFDAAGQVVQMYGRKVSPKLRAGTPNHLYLPCPQRGVWNLAALQESREVILCEALLDALTFWCAGYRNVTTAYGVGGVTVDHWEAFKAHGTQRVLIAFDRDDAGERAAAELAPKLQAAGIEAWRIQFPRGMDANEYACKVKPAEKSLGLVIRNAIWVGQGQAPRRAATRAGAEVVATVETPAAAPASIPNEATGKAAERKGRESAPRVAPDPAGAIAPAASPAGPAAPPVPAPAPPAYSHRADPGLPDPPPPPPFPPSAAGAPGPPTGPAPDLAPAAPVSPAPLTPGHVSPPSRGLTLERRGEELLACLGDRTYRTLGLAKNTAFEVLKVNLRVTRTDGRFHEDSLDLRTARHRQAFVKQAAEELGLEEETLKKDLGPLLLALEVEQDALIQKKQAPAPAAVAMAEAEREAALALLKAPDLLDRILADFTRCGVVGEETNKLIGYLAAVSRKLGNPLAVVIQSSSAAGKSSLMDAVLAFIPEEERVAYSAMTGQSLFYMGQTNLAHKILAIAEEEGAQRASYALKLLQSEGELTIASTGKDPTTGRLVTHEYKVEGPVMIFLTTTAIEMDEELLNRCLVLTVDEGREQTRAIHRLQRRRQTLEGLLEHQQRARVMKVHKNAQRLLRPLLVVNPAAEALTFLDHQTRTRRDHMKYLTLINAIALLHQHQREVKVTEQDGVRVEYVEATPADLAMADRLVGEVLGHSLDELPAQTRRLLESITELVTARSKAEGKAREDIRFTRRDVRERTGLGNTQLKMHIKRLEDLEYLLVHAGSRGHSMVYELAPAQLGSLEVRPAQVGGADAQVGVKSAPSRAQVGGVSAPLDAAASENPSGSPGFSAAEASKRAYPEAQNAAPVVGTGQSIPRRVNGGGG